VRAGKERESRCALAARRTGANHQVVLATEIRLHTVITTASPQGIQWLVSGFS
jgi:hypothetical protein